MKPFRKHVALAIDGGGIRGVLPIRALMKLESVLGQPLNQVVGLAAGTSTGSIISAGLGAGLSTGQIYQLYCTLGEKIFKKSTRSLFWPLSRYRYPGEPLENALADVMGNLRMGDFWETSPQMDVVITTYDLVLNRTRFIKPWKDEYADWSVVAAVMASSAVPTYFPVVDGRYVDGGVGSYSNPCYLAAYEAIFCLGWKPEETTLISLGTGRDPNETRTGQPSRYMAWDWLKPTLGAFMNSAADQQVHLVDTFFKGLDFRRFQVELDESIGMDEPSAVESLSKYGDRMASMILRDQFDCAMGITPRRVY